MKNISLKGIFNICNLYIVVWLLYNFHWNGVGNFFPLINTLSSLFLAFNLVISIYYTFVVINNFALNSFFRVLLILTLLFVIYGTFSVLQSAVIVKGGYGGTINSGTYMIGALRSFLPIYTFFLFSMQGYITEKTMRVWFWIFLIQIIYTYMAFRISMGLDNMDDMRTNNRGYLFVYLFPYVFLFRKYPYFQYLLIFICLFGALLSLKRGAILITFLATIYFIWNQLNNASVKKKGLAIVIIVSMVVYGSAFIENMYENSTTFQRRFDKTLDGDMSGRDNIASNLLDVYVNSDIINLLFGYGADGTLKSGRYAHNDWLEMLFDQGLLGFTVYFVFWFVFFRLWRKENTKKSEIAFFLGLLFICSFPKTLFSMWYSMANMFITMPLGYCIATTYLSKKIIE